MTKIIEFCPQCECYRELCPSLGLRTIINSEGKEDLLLYHYHCEACNTYVKSTTIEHRDLPDKVKRQRSVKQQVTKNSSKIVS